MRREWKPGRAYVGLDLARQRRRRIRRGIIVSVPERDAKKAEAALLRRLPQRRPRWRDRLRAWIRKLLR